MKSFYNIIKIATNATADESIVIGLFAYNGSRYFVQFSNNKKRIAKKLLESGADLVDFLSRQIASKVGELNQILSEDKSRLFETTSFIDSDYFDYLSRYSNNVLQFSNSYLIKDEINEEKFQKLFALFVDNTSILKTVVIDDKTTRFYERINEKLIFPVKDKVHTNIKLTQEVIPSLYFNYEMDCLGMNGVFTGAKSIDFSKSDHAVDRILSHYFQVSMLLAKNYQRDKKDNHFYIIGDEPNSYGSKEHKIWEYVKKQDIFQIIHSEESEIIAMKIEEIEAHTFLEV